MIGIEKKIGIVTVLYNSEKVLDDFFETLKRQSYKNFVLYVVDNFSPDNSLKKAKELATTCAFKSKFIENKKNYGVAKGNNQGIVAAMYDGCDYVLLSNNDVVLKDNTIEILYNGICDYKADMVVPKIYFYNSTKLWCAGGKFNKFSNTTTHFGYDKEDCLTFSKVKQVSYAPTCFMLIDKKVFHDTGLMDEKFFVYYDDTDFVYRTQKLRKKLFYIPDSVVEHKESACTGKRSDFFYRYIYRNRIYFISKHKKLWKIKFFEDYLFDKTIRKIKMRNNPTQRKIVSEALLEGYKMGIER